MTDVLDLIDGALRDYDLSGDAMRWSPDVGDGPWAGTSGWDLGWITEEDLPAECRERVYHGHVRIGPILASDSTWAGWAAPRSLAVALRPQICEWLKANRIDPMRVPIDTVPVVTKRWIYWKRIAVTPSGKMRYDALADDWVIVPTRTLLRVAPVGNLWEWLTGADPELIDAWFQGQVPVWTSRAQYGQRWRARRRRK